MYLIFNYSVSRHFCARYAMRYAIQYYENLSSLITMKSVDLVRQISLMRNFFHRAGVIAYGTSFHRSLYQPLSERIVFLMQEVPHDSVAPTDRSSASRPARSSRAGWLGGAVAAIIVILLFVAFVHLIGSPGSSPVMVTRGFGGPCPTATHYSQAVALSDLSMISPDEGWAVGGVMTFGGTSSEGVILHDMHGRWQQVSGNFKDMLFTSISMTSPTDGWLAGIIHNNMPNANSVFADDRLLYHYDGHAWKAVSFDQSAFNNNYGGSPGDLIVRMYSATDGWLMLRNTTLLGNYTLLHYDGSAWSQVQSPYVSTQSIFNTFYDMRVGGPDEIWLAGTYVNDSGSGDPGSKAIIAHYQAGAWSKIATTAGFANSLALTSATDGYVVDSDDNLILHFAGQHASPVSLPGGLLHAHETLRAIFAAPDGTIWVVGEIDSLTTPAPFLVRRLSDGSWKRMAISYPHVWIGELIFTSASDLWAVGGIPYQQGCAPAAVTELDQGTLLHWNGSQWSQTTEPVS